MEELSAELELAFAGGPVDRESWRQLGTALDEAVDGAPEGLRLFASYYERRLAEEWIAKGQPIEALALLERSLGRDYETPASPGLLEDLFLREMRAVTAEAAASRRFRAYRRALDAEERLIEGYASLLVSVEEQERAELEHALFGQRFELRKEAVRRLIELGLVDRAAVEFAEVRELLNRLWPKVDADPDQVVASAEDYFTAGLLEIMLELALGRHEDLPGLAADLRSLPQAVYFHRMQWLRVDIQVALSEDALAKIEGRAGQGASPYADLLEHQDFGLLDPFSRAQVWLGQANWCLSGGQRTFCNEALARAQAVPFDGARPALLERIELTLRMRLASEDGAPAAEVASLFDAFGRELDTWKAERDAGAEQAFLHFSGRAELLAELMLLLESSDPDMGSFAALDLWLQVESLGGLRRRMGADLARSGEFLGWWGARGGALLFVPGANRSLALCVEPKHVKAVPLPAWPRIETARENLERSLTGFVGSAGERGLEDLKVSQAELSKLIWTEEIVQFAEGHSRIAIVAPNNLGYLPFEAFELSSGRPLGVERAVEYWPSFAVARALEERAGGPTQGKSSRISNFDLAQLVHTRVEPRWAAGGGFEVSAEGQRDLTRLPADRVLSFDGRGDAFEWLCGPARDSAVWLLVAHGHYDPRLQPSAGLVLPSGAGQDRALYHDDPAFRAKVDGLEPAELVWLGACGAWRAPFRRGDDGDVQLAGRLLVAGSDCVIQPFTRQRFGDLQALTAPFSAALVDGASPAEALRVARAEALAGATDELGRLAPLLVHAFGSGKPMNLVTRPSELRTRSSRALWPWIAASVLLAGSGLWIGRRSRKESNA